MDRRNFISLVGGGVVLAAGGYPNDYGKGHVIHGLDANDADTKVFHAGTRTAGDACVTNGGRVLCVVGLGARVSFTGTEITLPLERSTVVRTFTALPGCLDSAPSTCSVLFRSDVVAPQSRPPNPPSRYQCHKRPSPDR